MHRDPLQWPPWSGRVDTGAKIVETLTFTRTNRAQVMVPEKVLFRSELCMHERRRACKPVHKCIGVRLGQSVEQYRLTHFSRPNDCRCICSGLTDGEWVCVTALWQSDESPSLPHDAVWQEVHQKCMCSFQAKTDQVWCHIERFGWTEAAEKSRRVFILYDWCTLPAVRKLKFIFVSYINIRALFMLFRVVHSHFIKRNFLKCILWKTMLV